MTIKGLYTILLLICSNTFMTIAWYGHLKFNSFTKLQVLGFFGFVLVSWGIAFFEYCFQVPANRIGFHDNGGPFSLIQLKLIQEVISICVFIVFTLLVFKNEEFKMNHVYAFLCILAAIYFTFKK